MRYINLLLIGLSLGCVEPESGFSLSGGPPVLETGFEENTSESETGEALYDLPPVKFDAGGIEEEDSVFECTDLDILFVVDNSGSMSDDQEKLVLEISSFVSNLTSLGIGENSMHIGVVSTDNYLGNPEECASLGALVTRTSSGYPEYLENICGPYSEGYNFMTEMDDLEKSFTCSALLGSNGSSSERQMEALIQALKPTPEETMSPFESRQDYCNEGFHRRASTNIDGTDYPGAGLVVIIITDEDDLGSPGEPVDWIEQIKWLRRPINSLSPGNLENTAFLALLSDGCNDYSDSERIKGFLEMVPVSHIGSICTDDYSDFFNSAIDIVKEGCGFEYKPTP